MGPVRFDDYVHLVLHGNLLKVAELEAALAAIPPEGELPPDERLDRLGRELVARKSLTPWQHAVLRSGARAGFFLGKFKLLEPVRGAEFFETYVAAAGEPPRKVLLRLVPPRRLQDAEFRRRLPDDLRKAQTLHHPGLLRLLGIEIVEPAVFLVLEFVPGASLADAVAETGPLPAAAVERIAAQLIDLLAYLHAQGTVHRRLRPAQLLLGPGGRVKLLGLGCVRAEEYDTVEAAPLPGLEYLAPEELAGIGGPPTDLYGLGATLYFLLVGRPPLAGTTAAELRSRIADLVPTPVADLRPDVPPALADLCRTLLAKDPAARPTAAELKAAWCPTGAPTLGAPESPPEHDSAPPTSDVFANPDPPTTTSSSFLRAVAAPVDLREAPPTAEPARSKKSSKRAVWAAAVLLAAAVLGLAIGVGLNRSSDNAAPDDERARLADRRPDPFAIARAVAAESGSANTVQAVPVRPAPARPNAARQNAARQTTGRPTTAQPTPAATPTKVPAPSGRTPPLDRDRAYALPGWLHPIFVESPDILQVLTERQGNVSLVPNEGVAGNTALLIERGSIGNPAIPGMRLPIRTKPAANGYRILSFAWRSEGKGPFGVDVAADGKYDNLPRASRFNCKVPVAGMPPPDPNAIEPPAPWQERLINLPAGCGEFEMTGLQFYAPNGKLWIDNVCVAAYEGRARTLGTPQFALETFQPIFVALRERKFEPTGFPLVVLCGTPGPEARQFPGFGLTGGKPRSVDTGLKPFTRAWSAPGKESFLSLEATVPAGFVGFAAFYCVGTNPSSGIAKIRYGNIDLTEGEVVGNGTLYLGRIDPSHSGDGKLGFRLEGLPDRPASVSLFALISTVPITK